MAVTPWSGSASHILSSVVQKGETHGRLSHLLREPAHSVILLSQMKKSLGPGRLSWVQSWKLNPVSLMLTHTSSPIPHFPITGSDGLRRR